MLCSLTLLYIKQQDYLLQAAEHMARGEIEHQEGHFEIKGNLTVLTEDSLHKLVY